MAISFVGQATGTTSVTVPTHQAGDMLIAFATNTGVATAPSLPTGWTNIANGTSNTFGVRLCYRIATAAGTTATGFTNSKAMEVSVYRPGSGQTISLGAASTISSVSNANITYPALTLQDTSGRSWVARFAAHKSTNTTLETPVTGYTLRSNLVNTAEIASFDTNSGTSTNPTAASRATGGTTAVWLAATLEIKESAPPVGFDPSNTSSSTTLGSYQGVANNRATSDSLGNISFTATLSVINSPSKMYFELDHIGLTTPTGYYQAAVSNDSNNSVGFFVDPSGTSGISTTPIGIFFNSETLIPIPDTPFGPGSTMCFAVDRNAEKIWAKVNDGPWLDGSGSASDPNTGTGGFSITGLNLSYVKLSGFGSDVGLKSGPTNSYKAPTGFTTLSGETPKVVRTGAVAKTEEDDTVSASNVVPTLNYGWDTTTTSGVTFSTFEGKTNAGALADAAGSEIQGAVGVTTGKYYFEYVVGYSTSYSMEVGISTNGFGTYCTLSDSGSTAGIMDSGGTGIAGPRVATGNTVGVAVDVDNKKIWFRVNSGSWWGVSGNSGGEDDPTVSSSGFPISLTTPIYPYTYFSSAPASSNLRLKDTSYSAPSGFTYLDGTGGTAPSGINGTVSITEASDTVATASTIKVSGTASITEASDTIAATSTVSFSAISGTASITEASDTVASASTIKISGTTSATEDGDTIAATSTIASGGAGPTVTFWDRSTKTGGGTVNFENTGVTLGQNFVAFAAVTVTHVSFWKVATDTTTSRTVGIWDKAGTLVASGTSSGEPTGTAQWVDVALTTPFVPTVATLANYGNNNFTIGYYAPTGRYTATAGTFSQGYYSADNAVYTFSNREEDVPNGLYNYATGMNRPTDQGGDYWIDLKYYTGTGSAGISGTASITEADDAVASASTITIKGTESSIEADDTVSSSAILAVNGIASITEANDTIVATSTITFNAISGTASITESGDTLTSASTVTIKGTESTTEANDTVVATAISTTRAAVSITETDDTVSSSSTIAIKGTEATTEADDIVASTAISTNRGVLALTEASDNVSSTATVTAKGTETTTEADDLVTSSSTLLISATATLTDSDDITSTGLSTNRGTSFINEADDTVVTSSTLKLNATAANTEADDNITASGVLQTQGGGVVIITEADDLATSVSTLALKASVAKTETDDTVSASGVLPVKGDESSIEQNDTVSSGATLLIKGIVAANDNDDTVASATVISIRGTAPITETDDTSTSTATTNIKAAVSITEANDTVIGSTNGQVAGTVVIAEASDTIASSAVLPLVATVAVSEQNDTTASSSKLDSKAVVAITEDNDAITATAVLKNTGTEASSEENDTLIAAARIIVAATAALQEQGDTSSGTAYASTLATVVINEADDAVSSVSRLPVAANSNVSENDDLINSNSVLTIKSQSGIIEEDDTVSFTSTIITWTFATVDIVEQDDTVSQKMRPPTPLVRIQYVAAENRKIETIKEPDRLVSITSENRKVNTPTEETRTLRI